MHKDLRFQSRSPPCLIYALRVRLKDFAERYIERGPSHHHKKWRQNIDRRLPAPYSSGTQPYVAEVNMVKIEPFDVEQVWFPYLLCYKI